MKVNPPTPETVSVIDLDLTFNSVKLETGTFNFVVSRYLPDGTFASASFLDYALPGPRLLSTAPALVHHEAPIFGNPEGFKGVALPPEELRRVAAAAVAGWSCRDSGRRLAPPGRARSRWRSPRRPTPRRAS